MTVCPRTSSGAALNRLAAYGIEFPEAAIRTKQEYGCRCADQDITCPVFGEAGNIIAEHESLKQGIILLVIDLSFIEIANAPAKRRHPNPAFRVGEHLQYLYIGQAIDACIISKMSTVKSAYACLGTHPQEPVLVLGDAVNSGAGEAIRDVIMRITVFLAGGGIIGGKE